MESKNVFRFVLNQVVLIIILRISPCYQQICSENRSAIWVCDVLGLDARQANMIRCIGLHRSGLPLSPVSYSFYDLTFSDTYQMDKTAHTV